MRSKLFLKIFILSLIGFIITFVLGRNYKTVTPILSVSIKDPIQKDIIGASLIEFERNGYKYELTPKAEYQLSGLLVNKLNYGLVPFYSWEKVFPMDYCLIWGHNVEDSVFRSPGLWIKQDMRFCYFRYRHKVDFDKNALSNNHIIIDNDKLLKNAKKVRRGDQITITGKLVDVRAIKQTTENKRDPEWFEMNTSLNRTDTGAGACEVIYVEDIKILQVGNPIIRLANKVFLWIVLILVLRSLALFFKQSKYKYH